MGGLLAAVGLNLFPDLWKFKLIVLFIIGTRDFWCL